MASEDRKTIAGGQEANGQQSNGQQSNGQQSNGQEPEDQYLKRQTVRAVLSHVIDPEVGLDILTMGLIYDVHVSEPDVIRIEMTLTTKGCPMSAYLTGAAKQAVQATYPDDDVQVQLVWDPPWTPAMINRDGLDLLRH